MRRTIAFFLSVSFFCFVLAVAAHAQAVPAAVTEANAGNDGAAAVQAAVVPRLISLSGRLKDRLGNPLAGVQGVTFALYKDQEGGSPLWIETQNVTADEQGRFAVLVGATKSDGLPLDLFTSGESRWLGVQAQVPGEVEQPRVLLVSVPYALKAADAETLGGKPASAYVLAPNQPGSGLADPSRDSNGAVASASSDASDPKKKSSLNTAAVTGGTPGTLGKFDADGVSLIDSALKETAGKIGLGVVPGYTFDLQAGTGAQDLLRFFRTGENIFTMSADANENAALFLADGAGAAKVKLGTADGDFRLDMNAGTGAQSVIRVFRPGENIFNFSTDANEHGILFLSNGSGSTTIKLHTAGDSFFTSGNVGIGTATPSEKLHVVGNLKIAGTPGVNGLIFPDGSTQKSALVGTPGNLAIRGINYIAGCDTCAILTDADDQKTFYQNVIGAMTLNSVNCFSDTGTATINIQRDDGVNPPANVLSGNLTCTTTGATPQTIVITTLNLSDKLDFAMAAVGITPPHRVTVVIKATVN